MSTVSSIRITGALKTEDWVALPTIAGSTAGPQYVSADRSWNYNWWRPVPLAPSSQGDWPAIVGSSDPFAPAQLARRTGGSISGTFKVNGVLKQFARIALMDCHTGQVIGTTLTDVNGAYQFNYLDLDFADYAVIGLDPARVERAEAYDRVQPL